MRTRVASITLIALIFVLVAMIGLLMSCAPAEGTRTQIGSLQIFNDTANNVVCYYIGNMQAAAIQCFKK